MSPLLQENGRMPTAYVGDANSLFWNFISFPRKPSYSASFLHWIFSLSYPYLTILYIFNSIVSWSPKLSPLQNPWLHRGWTPVLQGEGSAEGLHWSLSWNMPSKRRRGILRRTKNRDLHMEGTCTDHEALLYTSVPSRTTTMYSSHFAKWVN